jgi:hypothetical protein
MTKRLILPVILFLAAAAGLWAQGNVNVTNPTTRPVPVQTVVRAGSTSLAPNYYSAHITTNTTTTPTSATAYIATLQITCTNAGTTETIVVRNKEGTPKVLYQSGTLAVGNVITMSWDPAIVMTSGIDIVTAGTAPATVDVFITYWQ